jgi:heat-inducible transcriptional repressor
MSRKANKAAAESPELGERAETLLRALVQQYIDQGQPVGSRALVRESGLDISPATVRNVMADLEKLGLVTSPHTSAGRIPTNKGYRLFVDSLLTLNPLRTDEIESLKKQMGQDESIDSLLGRASSILSGVTRMAGVVMLPRRDYMALRRIEFLPLSERRVLAILVVSEKEVQNKIIRTSRDYSESELQQISNYLSTLVAGKDFNEVRATLLEELRKTKEHMNELMQNAMEMANSIVEQETSSDYVMAGETNLMTFAELSNVDELRQLFEAFSEKREILHLLDECLAAQGVQVFIGEESGYQVLDKCSIVTSPYEIEGKLIGVLGVIGPTRMSYNKVIPLVDVTAKMLGNLLKQQ